MQSRLGHDFSAVRIFAGPKAEDATLRLRARAYTLGSDIVFGKGRYAPHTVEGRLLLAHELAHVVQQSEKPREKGKSTDPEKEASKAAEMVTRGNAVTVQGAAAGIQLEPLTREEIERLDRQALERRLAENEGESTHMFRSPESLDELAKENLALKQALSSSALDARRSSVLPARSSKSVTGESSSQDIEGDTSGHSRESGSDAANATPEQSISVALNYEVVGMIGGGAPTTMKVPEEIPALLTDMFGRGGAGAQPIVLASPGARVSAPGSDVEPWLPGLVSASGIPLLRFVDPIPNVRGGSGPNVYTRFIGPESAEGFFEPSRLRGNELAPRYNQPAVGSSAWAERLKAFEIFKRFGISPAELGELSVAIRSRGVSGLSASEAALLQRVTNIHGQVAGATSASPLLSLTEHAPDLALQKMPRVASERAYVVRVRISPEDVGKVNEILKRSGQATEGMAGELEVIVGRDLTAGGKGAPRILSIVANPAKGAPLGGWVGPALRWGGRGMVFLGAALAVKDVLTAKGPHRRETQGRAFGSFLGGTALGALGAGLCVGLGFLTAGAGALLCGLGFGFLGAVGGSFAGAAVGRQFD